MNSLEIGLLVSVLTVVFSYAYFLFNEMEDEVVRDRSKNNPLFWIKNASSGANAKWHEPFEPYAGNYYPSWMKKPKHRERFRFSSTLLVPFTDFEHLYQFLKLRSINVIVLSIALGIHLQFDFMYSYFLLIFNQIGFWAMSFSKEVFFKNMN